MIPLRIASLALLVLVLFAPVRGADHIVIVVMDGLRPDSVTQEDMPNLFHLGQAGVRFAHHHPVYPSSTEVNGTAIATGGYPFHTNVMANVEYRPDIELMKPIGTEVEKDVRKGDILTNGHYIGYSTVAEIVRRAGGRTVVAGTKPVALLIDRSERDDAQSSIFYGGKTLPRKLIPASDPEKNDFPKKADERRSANKDQDQYTTNVLIDRLWAEGLPRYTLLWLSDPDYTQHGQGPGAEISREALRNSDARLGQVLDAVKSRGVSDSTDVLVVSDHGFSMIARNFDLTAALQSAGFDAVKTFTETPRPGQVMMVGNSGTVCLYVIGHEQEVINKLVAFCQQSDFAGVIFTRQPMPGTFALSQAAIDTTDAPDVVVSMRWFDEMGHGLPGTIVSESLKLKAGQGNHSSLSRYDMHNSLFAIGPDFKTGFVDELPSGNADVAPTVLHLLKLDAPKALDGRVLSEALQNGVVPADAPQQTTLHAAHDLGATHWSQWLKVTHLGSQIYLDEGNRDQADAPAAEHAAADASAADPSAHPAARP